jgi:hypothetical protein
VKIKSSQLDRFGALAERFVNAVEQMSDAHERFVKTFEWYVEHDIRMDHRTMTAFSMEQGDPDPEESDDT